MVHSICQELLTQMGVINKSKSLLRGIHGNEETASKTIQKITIINANSPATSKTTKGEMD